MKALNSYANRSRISEAKFRQIIRDFAVDMDASEITKVSS